MSKFPKTEIDKIKSLNQPGEEMQVFYLYGLVKHKLLLVTLFLQVCNICECSLDTSLLLLHVHLF